MRAPLTRRFEFPGMCGSLEVAVTALEARAVKVTVRAANVMDAPANTIAILQQVEHALAPGFVASLTKLKNPYGDGHAAERIVDILSRAPFGSELLIKRAVNLAETEPGSDVMKSLDTN